MHVLSYISHRIAYGPPRAVNFEDEVVVVTGGRKGLGCCLAEIYALKGAGVAVLEKHGGEGDDEEDGIRRFSCDVGNREEVESVWKKVVEEVSNGSYFVLPREFVPQIGELGIWTGRPKKTTITAL